jgi:hypothetical protein
MLEFARETCQDNCHTIVGQEVAREDRGQRVIFSNTTISGDQAISIDTSENAFTPEQQVTCAVIQAWVSFGWNNSQSFYVLVLERGNSGTDTFKRIGIAYGVPLIPEIGACSLARLQPLESFSTAVTHI